MKIGITTFGGDGGKSGISQYIINILKEFAALEDRPDFEVIVYEDEKELLFPIRTACRPSPLVIPCAALLRILPGTRYRSLNCAVNRNTMCFSSLQETGDCRCLSHARR